MEFICSYDDQWTPCSVFVKEHVASVEFYHNLATGNHEDGVEDIKYLLLEDNMPTKQAWWLKRDVVEDDCLSELDYLFEPCRQSDVGAFPVTYVELP